MAVTSLLLPASVFAWGAAGHQLIAAEAYRELSPQLKAQVIETIDFHLKKWCQRVESNH